ncbi:filamentous hemagglutinin / adhesin [Cordyceps javanica]|uniref:Filamentous hemagglutinin / adhesin n=1 Tax=Cordyceps javanica TaxID=43265 RepID=A0A545V8R7_9HYPO|nr:filamentous hemagglutinin / adhesin [Cordyceps javanica]TQW08701.1 filamentous hemagglutinin / adhesin [Cordyceps javanica]
MKFLATMILPCLAGASVMGIYTGGLGGAKRDSLAAAAGGTCDCKGATAAAAATDSLCGDARLGPKTLPTKLPLAGFMASYSRLGGENNTVEKFLAEWIKPEGGYRYPPQNGFMLDVNGNAINGTMELPVGTLIDRFGSERGSYVTAASAPFSQRSLPPSSLATDPRNPDFPYSYHLYQVVRPFNVTGGPIAPWFGQPGLGAQFWTGLTGRIVDLITNGYIERQDPYTLVALSEGPCTQA